MSCFSSLAVAVAAAGLFARAADAQAWGTTGSWQAIAPTTSVTGPQGWGARPVSVGGTIVYIGNNSATGLQALWSFDAFRRAWTKWPDLPAAWQPTQPFLLASGGIVAVLDEPNPNVLYWMDSANAGNAGAAYQALNVAGAPQNRYGQRLIDWAGALYSFGGFENSTVVPAGIQHNDLYALDLLAMLQGSTSVVWTQVSPDGAPGFPLARVGASFTAFNVAAVLFGGAFSGDPLDQDAYDVCFPPWPPAPGPPPTVPNCFLLSETWLFLPGNTAPSPGSVTQNNWIKMQTSGFNGGAAPTGRFQHSAGYMGDQLYVFGGISLSPPGSSWPITFSTELWALNLMTSTWVQVAQTTPWPERAGGWFSTGLVLGRSFYIYELSRQGNQVGARSSSPRRRESGVDANTRALRASHASRASHATPLSPLPLPLPLPTPAPGSSCPGRPTPSARPRRPRP